MGKILEYGDEAREKILSGVEKLARTVKVTMGPRGRNVIVGKSVGAPKITKDGVSVAREVVLDDPIEELGCQLVKEAAGRTAAVAGDGTTTATVLTHSILSEGMSLMKGGYSPICFRDGIDRTKQALLEEVSKLAKPLDSDDSLFHVATVSVNNDKALGRVIADAYMAVNREGMVTVEAAPGVPSSVRTIDGLELDTGYVSPLFLNKGESKRELEKTKILIFDWEVTTHMETDFQEAMKKIATCKNNILLICKDLKKEGLQFFASNFQAGRLSVCAVKTPKFRRHAKDWMGDIAALTGTTIIGGDYGLPLEQFQLHHMGSADRVIVDSYKTKIVGPQKNAPLVEERIRLYEEALKRPIGDTDKEDIRGRLSLLKGSAAVITVGYNTELELLEKGDRVEDALFAVKAALEEGYVVGGGFALWRAAEAVERDFLPGMPVEEQEAARVLLRACRAPAEQIIRNAGLDPEQVLSNTEFLDGLNGESAADFGYNTATGKYGNLIKMGIIDPKKVTRTALENATSIAQLLLTTDAVIADNPHNESGWQPPAGYRLPNEQGLNHKH